MTGVVMRAAGSVDLNDLAAICQLRGHEYLPYPFMQTRSRGRSAPNADAGPAPDRFDQSDRPIFDGWMDTYKRADIWVECRVFHSNDDVGDTRILAHRADQSGFLASQRPDEDIIDVFELSPYKLGAAIANSAGLIGPGSHSQIVIPKYVDYFSKPIAGIDGDDYEFSVLRPVRSTRPGPATTVVPNADVVALAIVQSRCEPARTWGVDWHKKFVAWVQIGEDGNYIYAPDFSHAVPATEEKLSDRIDRLIAEDVAVLRQRRLGNK